LSPYRVQERRLKLTFLGNAGEVKKLLARADQVGQEFKILSLTDARFAPDSILQKLTEKQRRILSVAFTSGYYDLPSRIGSEELAKRLDLILKLMFVITACMRFSYIMRRATQITESIIVLTPARSLLRRFIQVGQ